MNAIHRLLPFAFAAALPQVFATTVDLPDVNGLTSGFDASSAIVLISRETHPALLPIDDEFEGRVIFTFSIRPLAPAASFHQHYLYFMLRNEGGTDPIPLRVGNEWEARVWSFRNPEHAYLPLLNDSLDTVELVQGRVQSFVLVLDFRAGGSDGATVFFEGRENVLPERNYSFTHAVVQGGFGTGGAPIADFLDIRVEITEGDEQTPPDPPTGLMAMVGDRRVDLVWTGHGEVHGYHIWRATGSGPLEMIGETNDPTFTDTGVVNGIAYRYAVSAFVTGVGGGGLSTEVVATPMADSTSWRGHAINEAGWVDTGAWFGRLHVANAPWVYSELLDKWIYIPATSESTGPTWIFIPKI